MLTCDTAIRLPSSKPVRSPSRRESLPRNPSPRPALTDTVLISDDEFKPYVLRQSNAFYNYIITYLYEILKLHKHNVTFLRTVTRRLKVYVYNAVCCFIKRRNENNYSRSSV